MLNFELKANWRPVSKEEYIKSAFDLENLYYIRVKDGVPHLLADIEYYGDESVQLRVELFAEIYPNGFVLYPAGSGLSIYDNISDLVSECRSCYPGGICFIEYPTREEAERNVLNDFINTYGVGGKDVNGVCLVYIQCHESALHQLVQVFPNSDLFIEII